MRQSRGPVRGLAIAASGFRRSARGVEARQDARLYEYLEAVADTDDRFSRIDEGGNLVLEI